MGVISFFQRKIYDSRLNKAGKLLEEGRKEESLQLYSKLLGKHPEAAGILADIYFHDIKNSKPINQVGLLKLMLDLPAQNGQELVWDRTGYDKTLSKTVSFLYTAARKHQNDGLYKDAYTLLNSLRSYNLASPDALNLFVDSCLGCVSKKESIDINSLRIVINNLGDERTIYETYDKFIPYIKEFSADYIKSSSWYILNAASTNREAVEKFERCWILVNAGKTSKNAFIDAGVSNKNAFLKEIINSPKKGLGKELFLHIVSHPNIFLQNDETNSILIKWASCVSSLEESESFLCQLHTVGVKVQSALEERVHSGIGSVDADKKRDILKKALELFPDSISLLNDKLDYAKELAKAKHYSEALEICDELIGKHKQAALTKAKVYVCIAHDENDPDKKIESLTLASGILGSEKVNDNEYKRILAKIQDVSLDTAEIYHHTGNKTKSYDIVRDIKNARSTLILARFLSEDIDDVAKDNRIQYYRDCLNELKEANFFEVFESESYMTLWSALTEAQIEASVNMDHVAAISLLKGIIEELEEESDSIDFSSSIYSGAIEKAKKEQIKRMYLLAREHEKQGQIEQAASLYSETKKIEGKSSPTLADFRYVICKLKAGDYNVSLQNGSKIESLLKKAPEAYSDERSEIAYRYALQLLKVGKTDKSLSILNQYLPNETVLRQACEHQFIVNGLNRLDEFNTKLTLIKKRELSSDEAIHMVNHMLEFADDVKYVVSIERPRLSLYRKSIKNYAILKLFDEGKYDVAFDKLKKDHSDFLNDLTSLRNIAIVCLNMAENGMINDDNYEEVISIWLTAIYQERLFIKSLDYTSWDDQYTFSLADAYGHFDEDSVGDLPDNVNFDEPDGNTNIVAIKDVQQSLLNRFEAAINDNNCYLQFFNEQKGAMDDLIRLNLDEKCRIVAPFFAEESDEIFAEIESAFETDRINLYANYEDVLATGYKFGLTDDEYGDYHDASIYYDGCVMAIDKMNLKEIESAFTKAKIATIKDFRKKWDSMIAFVKGRVGSLGSTDKSKFELYYNCYLVVCKAVNDQTVSFPFANYVMQHIVAEVNGHRISKAKASKYILSVYTLDPSNSRIQDNLTTLFEMLAREDDAESRNAVTTILNRTQNCDSVFYGKLNKKFEHAKLDKELNEIVDQVNNKTLQKSVALERVYRLYKSFPNNSRVCENLAQISNLCIVEYVIGFKSGSKEVQNVLDDLKNNMSVEFRKHTQIFKDTYSTIWNSLPLDTMSLLIDGDDLMPRPITSIHVYGEKSLNAQGYAMKRGLSLLKHLGLFTTKGGYPVGDLGIFGNF